MRHKKSRFSLIVVCTAVMTLLSIAPLNVANASSYYPSSPSSISLDWPPTSLVDILDTWSEFGEIEEMLESVYGNSVTPDLGIMGGNIPADNLLGPNFDGNANIMWSDPGLYACPAGDLDGDGLDDVLVSTITPSGCGIVAKRGYDGAILWEQFAYGEQLIAIPAGNLDSDGMDDVVVHAISPMGSTLTARRGCNGTSLWEYTSSGAISLAVPANDLDGDGLDDVLIHLVDMDGMKLDAKRGYDGVSFWNEQVQDSSIIAIPANDLDGDGKNDVLLHIVGESQSTVAAKHGHNGNDMWKEVAADNARLLGIPAGDLNGDGKDDVVIHGISSTTSIVVAKQGYNGYNLWRTDATDAAIIATPVGDLNLDGKDDVITHLISPTESIVTAKHGHDGSYMWHESAPTTLTLAAQAGDLDGDGRGDIILHAVSMLGTTTVTTKQGYSGTTLWEKSVTEGSLCAIAAGDLDNNGLDDMLLETIDVMGCGIAAIRGNDGSNLWTVQSELPMWVGINLQDLSPPTQISCSSDFDGDGMGDVLIAASNTIYTITLPSMSVYEDPYRGTKLSVNFDDKTFRFTTPDGYDTGVIQATNLVIRGDRITLRCTNRNLRFDCSINTVQDICEGRLFDNQRGRVYVIYNP